jgi:hypothetical protein
MAALTAVCLFAAAGAWIFYNTNIVNAYATADDRERLRADFERSYGRWENADAPSFDSIDLAVDFYPSERRLESRGTAILRNNKPRSIGEFALSLNPRLHVHALSVQDGQPITTDTAQGFYLFKLASPLPPGKTLTLTWNLTRSNPGFVNSDPDNTIVENGTYVDTPSIMPTPGYDEERGLTDPAARKRQGLVPAPPLPRLGDPAYLGTLRSGVDSRASFRVVLGTSNDQTAVAPGVLKRQWDEHGRRYVEYRSDRPVWPALPLFSARYAVERDTWEGVSLEVYYDAHHPWNVGTMLDSAKKAMAYYSREFGRYPLSTFRIAEYPRYSGAAKAAPGSVAYSESAGFLTDASRWAALDYTTLHELAHQWWGGWTYGARMQGRQMLNETMAQYSTFMMFQEYADPVWLRRIRASTLDAYSRLRSQDTAAEQPLILTEDQGNISYNKGALAMFALQDAIGADRMHEGLRRFLQKFGFKPPPFPTSRDLVDELRAAAGPEYQTLITNLFERIVLYDLRVDAARVVAVGGGYEVAIDVTAHQFESSGLGVESEVPLDGWFTVAVFPESPFRTDEQTPLYAQKHRLVSGTQTVVVRVPAKPGAVGVDPYHLMIDRTPANNVLLLNK